MPKRKNKKTLYLDTNVILDLLLKRSNEAVVLVESVKSRRWGVITSTLSLVEMSDWKKRDLFMRNKVELFWSMDSILSKKNETDLGESEFKKVEKWLLDSAVSFKPDYYDLADAAGWLKLREISTSTNLLAKDAMQFCTALIAALNGECNFFVTSDGNLIKEAKGYLRKNRLKGKLDVLTPREFAKLYPPHRN
jgi:predicted nucleic acid-binding protein